jgi:uncharacterized repeat protein (TIGR03803 family)
MHPSTLILAITLVLSMLPGGRSGNLPNNAAQEVSRPSDAVRKIVLHDFGTFPDGVFPSAPLVIDKAGSVYGTTIRGGTHNCGVHGLNCGTVFKLTPSGSGYKESILHNFHFGNDGTQPVSLIVDDKGALYGTTYSGGSKTGCFNRGCGIIFQLTPTSAGYEYTILYRFRGESDAATPGLTANLTMDDKGALYGTTNLGGGASQCAPYGCGTVFKLTPSRSGYQESVVHAFSQVDGNFPAGGVIVDKAGVIYGTTSSGGQYYEGNVFKLTPTATGFALSILYSFKAKGDGANADSSLVFDNTGALYGIADFGGGKQANLPVAFKLTPSGSGYTESVIHVFQELSHPSGVIMDKAGAFYGTTSAGGTGHCGSNSCGTVFKLAPSGMHYRASILYSFQSFADGGFPVAGVVADAKGDLYGTTTFGGTSNYGTAFELIRH